MRNFFRFVPVLALWACSQSSDTTSPYTAPVDALFQRMSSVETGVAFENTLVIKEDFDVFRYRNFYNGGGVGIGDINNDGLADIYLTSNMGKNKLFLNKGNWKFEDITEKAGVGGTRFWSTGVSFADVNADGLLDMYVCNAGNIKGDDRENELFINNGNLTFTEKAAEYGLADKGFSTHAAFFDFDKDGDLDCYVLNNSARAVASLGYRNLRNVRDEFGGHKLYRNDDGHFTDISEQAGIYGSVIGFGLGVTIGDVNQDSWPDMYISNDFYERDYLYINNRNGTFSERLEQYMGHISMFSMGADLADINNDGYPDIFSTDMLPDDDYRLKTLTTFETYDVYKLRLKNGYYHQYMRNMLHLNAQDGTFREIAYLAGVQASDWSWGALIADFNNDLNKEIFISNGIYRDITNQDFVEFLGNSEQMHAAIDGRPVSFKEFVEKMPSVKVSNRMYERQGSDGYDFKDVASAWGLAEPGFSNGAAYGDLDNDGDLDLIVNNVNQPVSVYRNGARQRDGNHSLTLRFKGTGKNTFGLGACVRAYVNGQILSFDNMPIRGFQSSMDYQMVIGLGKYTQVDSLVVTWPDNKAQALTGVKADQSITLNYADARPHVPTVHKDTPLLREESITAMAHTANDFNDFDRDRLLYHMLSTQGPAFSKSDLNNDGYDDFFLGGSPGHPGAVYIQKTNHVFTAVTSPFLADSLDEDVAAVFFDADNDKDDDLYVVTGGSEYTAQSARTQDRFYENKGFRNGVPVFEKTSDKIPALYQSGSCVVPADIDNDGDLDLFVGTRVMPAYYGVPCDQYILINDGHGTFSDVTATWASELRRFGMVTAAQWFDYDKNGYKDLMLVGEGMPITVFTNDGKKLQRQSVQGLDSTNGWWNVLSAADLDGDGDTDFIAGNIGLNTKFKPTVASPITVYVNDFDQNGSVEPVFAFLHDGKEYPMALRQDIVRQMSSLKKKFLYYKDYADKTIPDIFDAKLLQNGTILKFYNAGTSLLINNGTGGFACKPLPAEAQFAPVYGIEVADLNNDTYPDIILGGNLFAVKPEAGRYDALHGLVLTGDGKGSFRPLSSRESGVNISGEVRHIATLAARQKTDLAFIRHNDTLKLYTPRK